MSIFRIQFDAVYKAFPNGHFSINLLREQRSPKFPLSTQLQR